MTPDPAIWQQRGRNGYWYKIGKPGATPYRIESCGGCGRAALMKRGQRFCSYACRNRNLFVGPANSRYKDNPHYGGRHDRVRAERGPASQQTCLGCGGQAEEWSQVHGTDGLDVHEHYEPRCVPCHRQYDIDNRPRGERHVRSKLTDAQRRRIRASVGATLQELAEHFGVSVRTIRDVRSNRRG